MPAADDVVQHAQDALDRLYRSIEAADAPTIRDSLQPDVFVFTPTADGVLTSSDAVVADIDRWSQRVAQQKTALRLTSNRRVGGASPTASGAWIFDDLVAEAMSDGRVRCTVPIRLTALLVPNDGWRVAACYWSVPFPTQDEQDHVKHAGDLALGRALVDEVAEDAEPLVAALHDGLTEPSRLPALYSSREDHVTIGSVVDEVFLGPAGRAAWTEFVQYVSAFVPRGGVRAALASSDLAWLAANIDIGSPPTPYRFFYIWVHEEDGWQIVVSHDGVSRDPFMVGEAASDRH